MATFNQCTFIGRLGKDPEMTYTPNAKAVTKFSLAVDQGKGQEPLWLNIVCWELLAERMNTYLTKGRLVFVQGKLVVRNYTDKARAKRMVVEVIASTVQILEKKDEKPVSSEEPVASNESESDVPF